MKDGPNIVNIAALIGDHARAEVLTALMSGMALTATELATAAGVTKQTISGHLAKLVDAGLLAVESQGRHRYFRLSGPDVAELLESMMGLAFRTGAVRVRTSPREPAMRKARVCYDHLAGELGVMMYEGLAARGAFALDGAGVALTEAGRAALHDLGIESAELGRSKRPLCRTCLDWSERRHHLAGALGAALLDRFQQLGWARRQPDSRVVAFTEPGERALRAWCVG
ncbi:ArsR family transcriptional regulator [Massilia arenosa]|uniref:ArsR family transcriptional regulator n=2 Tax=Zemynaea arenosa TaxID=2561931 RepID=A0A4Y9SAT0_9BURK|nr:ArsR family transcriptional regulator [Massilia arenosa]